MGGLIKPQTFRPHFTHAFWHQYTTAYRYTKGYYMHARSYDDTHNVYIVTFIHPFIHPFHRSFVHSFFIRPFHRPFVHSFCSPIRSYIWNLNHSSIYVFKTYFFWLGYLSPQCAHCSSTQPVCPSSPYHIPRTVDRYLQETLSRSRGPSS